MDILIYIYIYIYSIGVENNLFIYFTNIVWKIMFYKGKVILRHYLYKIICKQGLKCSILLIRQPSLSCLKPMHWCKEISSVIKIKDEKISKYEYIDTWILWIYKTY